MIKTVVSVGLPVDENMIIRKNTLIPEEIKGDENLSVSKLFLDIKNMVNPDSEFRKKLKDIEC